MLDYPNQALNQETTMQRILTLFSLTLCLFAATLAYAQESVIPTTPGTGEPFAAEDQNGATAILTHLTASHGTVTPGQTLQLAWQFKLQPGWHIYWSNAGDSGLPPQLKAEGSTEALPLIYPVPHVISIPPVTNYGYEDEVTFTTTYTLPNLESGITNLTFNGNFLYCKDICLPGRAKLTLPLVVSDAAEINPAYNPQQNLPLQLDAQPLTQFNGSTEVSIKLPANATNARFIPAQDGVIDDSAAQPINKNLSGNYLIVPLDPQTTTAPTKLDGLLIIDDKGYTYTAPIGGSATAPQAIPPQPQNASTPTPATSSGLAAALFFAFIAGVILNLMPCVLPVLSLKLLGLVRHHHGAQRTAQTLAYTAGVILSFWAFALVIILLQKGGTQLGWGFHLQNPLFVALLTLLMLTVALNFFGVFEAGLTLTRFGSQPVKDKHPLWQNFATGVLAVIVATPCTVPFMGSAMAYALTQGAFANFVVFTALGLGLSFPFLLAIPFPAIFRWLPKPGAWMATFRHLLGWPMLATAMWLAYVFGAQAGLLALFGLFTVALILAFALWLYGTRPHLLTLAIAFAVVICGLATLQNALDKPTMQAWQPWSPEAVTAAVDSKRPVFVDFTADWCVTCKVVEATVLNTQRVQTLFTQHNTLLLTGDWTSQNPAITEELAKHNRKGVPLYLLYLPGNPEPRILPQLLTPGILEDALKGL